MAEVIIISAMARNRAIGKDGDIPWSLKEDFQHFQETTMGHPCVMGDKTYESLPDNARPLPGRDNIVLSLDPEYSAEGAKVFNSWEAAIEYLKGNDKIYICGGASIYKLFMDKADKMILTEIDKEFEADTFFPEFDSSEWEKTEEEKGNGNDRRTGENLSFSFVTYRRKNGIS